MRHPTITYRNGAIHKLESGDYVVSLDRIWVAGIYNSIDASMLAIDHPDLAESIWSKMLKQPTPHACITVKHFSSLIKS